ncbi:serine protein kinase RIO [Candidatus Woesearchaeota archaeon]|nr:serine protein kinase RIO [Candidatus Woesearchaeota archaeon]
MATKGKEELKTYGDVFDQFTNRTVFKLISEGYFAGLESPIALGKEANIFSAKCQDGSRVMVKIYRLETCDFNRMYDYLKEDPRYVLLKGKKRKVIFQWVQREYRNLLIAREAGIRVPMPLRFLNNVLVLEFIGDEGNVAPKLLKSPPKDKKAFFSRVADYLRKFYAKGMVHADLSAFNILNYRDEPVFIDFSQATPLRNFRAEEFLLRDVKNLCTYFRKIGLEVEEGSVLNFVKGKKKNYF